MPLADALKQSLLMVTAIAAEAEDPWWIIGSAAIAVHGARVAEVRDVDLLMSVRDAERTLLRLGSTAAAGEASDRFRSTVFGVWRKPPLPVEIMGDFSVATPTGWVPVSPTTRLGMIVEGCEVFVPSAAELADILVMFGRRKDLQRLRLLQG
jgi:hypothetical protein